MDSVYHLQITEDVTQHFQDILDNPVQFSEQKIIQSAQETLGALKQTPQQIYVENHIEPLQTMLDILQNKKWKISSQDRKYIVAALQYFALEEDVIPDNIPVVGLLDDCIVIDIVTQRMQKTLNDFKAFHQAERQHGQLNDFSVDDWHKSKKRTLFSRLRHRRCSVIHS